MAVSNLGGMRNHHHKSNYHGKVNINLQFVRFLLFSSKCKVSGKTYPSIDLFRFPTIYWSPMGSKDSPKKYQGGREVKDFIEFIKREATNPVVIEEKKKKKKKTEL